MSIKKIFVKEEIINACIVAISTIFFVIAVNIVAKKYELANKILLSNIYASYIFHFYFYLIELPSLQFLLSISVQMQIHRLLSTFPVIKTGSIAFIYCLVAFILNTILMVISFKLSKTSIPEKIIVYLISSLTPLTFFIYILMNYV